MEAIFYKISTLSRDLKLLLIIGNDCLLGFICWAVFGPPMATMIASEFSSGFFDIIYSSFISFAIPIILAISYLYLIGFYKTLIKFFDSKNFVFQTLSGALVFGFSWAVLYVYQFPIISTSFLSIAVLQGLLLAVVFSTFLNLSRNIAQFFLYPDAINLDAQSIVIYGAGASGTELYQSILLDPSKHVIAFYDDAVRFKNREIFSIPILGSFGQLIKLKLKHPDLEVLLAIPSIQTEKRRTIIGELEKIKVAVRTVPRFHELLSDQKKMADIQPLSLDDLLPRQRVSSEFLGNIKDKVLFISGAGGSIGSEIVRQLLEQEPHKIILFDISEINLFNIERECQANKSAKKLSTEIIPILGDIKNTRTLSSLFKKYHINSVYHAAAYKHVPIVEDINNAVQACENNILGTLNLALIAGTNNVDSFVMISTDKAVRPSNIMGASKRMAEMIIQSLNSRHQATKFSMVRFGNVINSSGSVLPMFLDQISQGGPLTITHKDVTRYFMTIPEASNLVLQASMLSSGGEVFILDMGEQLQIYELAKKLIHLSGRNIALEPGGDGIEITEIGLRPGEKMYEELLISGDQLATDNPKIFKSMEQFPDLDTMDKIILQIKEVINDNSYTGLITILKTYVEGYK
ncbi:polysaccharide biosynthesis protein [Gammaproteobacteria bacterium]|jgi:FlaA1/EpsC-like NDP-sugar epimerase|nr:polysaccharide biosynthesis protein [Gammaproteobacteria bacterium]